MTLSGMVYICSAGEAFDSAALAVYGDEKYAPELMCANPELTDRQVFSGGERLKLPVIEVPGVEDIYAPDAAPWKG